MNKQRTVQEKIGFAVIALSSVKILYDILKRATTRARNSSQLIRFSKFNTLDELVEHLVEKEFVVSDVLVRVMRTVDRANYCHNLMVDDTWTRVCPYDDAAQPLPGNATLSSPHMHASCLQALVSLMEERIAKNEPVRVLDVGSGSGYCCAVIVKLLEQLCRENKALLNQCRVFGIEHVQELVKVSRENLESDPSISSLLHLIEIREGDGLKGIESESPFDIIHCGAALTDLEVAGAALFSQLSPTGRMVIPIGSHYVYQTLSVVEKSASGKPIVQPIGRVRFVPLSTLDRQIHSTYSNHIQPKVFKQGNDPEVLVMPFLIQMDDPTNIKSLKDIKWEGS